MKAICLLSGGIDSAVAAYSAAKTGKLALALAVDYGQRHRREIQASRLIADKLNVPWKLLDLSSFGALLENNALTGSAAVPEGEYTPSTMPVTAVPLRNGLFLVAACAIAMDQGYDEVVIGIHSGDHVLYPDCRPPFITALQGVIDLLTDGRRVSVRAPFLHQTKADIVAVGDRLGVSFELTWSCYQGADYHCGRCATCVERKEAFRLAGVPDPTIYV